MTPFEVYLLMQVDKFITLFGVISTIAGAITVIFWGMILFDEDIKKEVKVAAYKICKWTTFWFAVSTTLCVVIPSTQTIASMIILPKLTSPAAVDAISASSKQLYDLALKALHNIAAPAKDK